MFSLYSPLKAQEVTQKSINPLNKGRSFLESPRMTSRTRKPSNLIKADTKEHFKARLTSSIENRRILNNLITTSIHANQSV